MTIASTAIGVAGQDQQARQQEAYNRRNAEAAREALIENYATAGLQRSQEREAASANLENARREALQARATQAVAAGEAGVSGLSVDSLARDFTARELNYATNTTENYARKSAQIQREEEGMRAGTISQINQNTLPVNKPSYVEAGVRVGAGVFTAYDRYYGLKIPTENPKVSNAGMASLANRGSKW